MIPARPKYQVFISSTYADLREEREAVTWAILTARHIPVGMEVFTATDDRGWQTIRSVIDRTDYYVLLLAGRYGSVDKDGLSWTEKEYDYAASKKIPTLVFIRSKASITADLVDDDPLLRKKIEEFKRRVRETHHCVDWTTKDELVSRVSGALRNHIIDDEDNGMPRPGWYRGDELPKTATLDEFARLSSETARLKEQKIALEAELADLKKVSSEIFPRLSEIRVVWLKGPYPKEKEEFSVTYQDIFLMISYLISKQDNRRSIMTRLPNYIVKSNGESLVRYRTIKDDEIHNKYAFFDEEEYDSILAHLFGWGLISFGTKSVGAGDRDKAGHVPVVKLTDFGQKQFSLLMTGST